MSNLNDLIVELSALVDSTYPADLDREAHLWRRCMKVAEESGEVAEALFSVLGENPRKSSRRSNERLVDELLDTALAALGAVAHISGNAPSFSVVDLLEDHVAKTLSRLQTVLDPGRPM